MKPRGCCTETKLLEIQHVGLLHKQAYRLFFWRRIYASLAILANDTADTLFTLFIPKDQENSRESISMSITSEAIGTTDVFDNGAEARDSFRFHLQDRLAEDLL